MTYREECNAPISIVARFSQHRLKLSCVSVTYWHHNAPPHLRIGNKDCRQLSPADLAHTAPDIVRLRYNLSHKRGATWRYWDYHFTDETFKQITENAAPHSSEVLATDVEKAMAFELLKAVI